MDLKTLESLVGYELPVGEYSIGLTEHKKTLSALHQQEYDFESVHPIYAHLGPHCGMGYTIEEFFDFLDFPMEGGALYGEGELTYHKPMHIDVEYIVKGRISAVERKEGARTGIFDLVTLELGLYDERELVVTSIETYVLPRRNL